MVTLPIPVVSGWENFFVIVGSSGAALIGLQFVVITLMAEMRGPSTDTALGAFATPTVVHLGAALMISAIMSAPWPSMTGLTIGLGICGVSGFVYCGTVFYRTIRQTIYKPVFEDWLWHIVLPSITYAVLGAAAVLLRGNPATDAFFIAGSALALLYIAIHNAWDTSIYLLSRARARNDG